MLRVKLNTKKVRGITKPAGTGTRGVARVGSPLGAQRAPTGKRVVPPTMPRN